MKILGTTDENSVAYIDDEYLASDFQELKTEEAETTEIDGITIRVWYGWNMAYRRRNDGSYIYTFKCGPGATWANRCGNQNGWCTFQHWNHYSTGATCNGSAVLQFREENS